MVRLALEGSSHVEMAFHSTVLVSNPWDDTDLWGPRQSRRGKTQWEMIHLGGSLMAQQAKDPALSLQPLGLQLWGGFAPRPGHFHMSLVQPKKKKNIYEMIHFEDLALCSPVRKLTFFYILPPKNSGIFSKSNFYWRKWTTVMKIPKA